MLAVTQSLIKKNISLSNGALPLPDGARLPKAPFPDVLRITRRKRATFMRYSTGALAFLHTHIYLYICFCFLRKRNAQHARVRVITQGRAPIMIPLVSMQHALVSTSSAFLVKLPARKSSKKKGSRASEALARLVSAPRLPMAALVVTCACHKEETQTFPQRNRRWCRTMSDDGFSSSTSSSGNNFHAPIKQRRH